MASVFARRRRADRTPPHRGDRRMKEDLNMVAWPGNRVGEALEILALQSGLTHTNNLAHNPSDEVVGDQEAFDQWVDSAAACLEIEAEPSWTRYAQLDPHLRAAG